ncbi:pheST operon leader peptide PheM [Serratia quinivorans]|nr:pheST operon leader peptide PheM [Serratia quinivorans]
MFFSYKYWLLLTAAVSLVGNHRQGNAIMNSVIFRFFFYFSA